MIILEC